MAGMDETEDGTVESKVEKPKLRRRGVLAIPTLLTIMNVLFGFIAILLAMRASQANVLGDSLRAGRLFQLACWSLIIAAIFDTFDGLVARLMKATTEFGKEYDSLADIVTFGVAPAVLAYAWGLNQLGRLGAGIAFLFLVAGSLRLARFNIISTKSDHRYFVGLPIPAGALTLSSVINYAPQPVTDKGFAIVMMVVTIFIAFAMVSTVRYRSQKFSTVQKPVPVQVMLFIVLMIALFLKWPAEFMLLFGIFYVGSGPVVKLWSVAFPRSPEPEAAPPSTPSEQH